MNNIKSRRVVVKVGTSTLTYENGNVNLRNLEKLCKVLSDLHNSGKQIILVSSGAIGVGVGKLKIKERPRETRYKQAIAAVGQCELMFLYDKFFGEYNNDVAQVLLTRDVVVNDHSRQKFSPVVVSRSVAGAASQSTRVSGSINIPPTRGFSRGRIG